ncbi:hypothetical protein ACIREO_02860 [Streptomyces sp. NPDC102441]|uniref:hypothetical protein n=1 Tax=Streptomyces sp. NPDC102441 TaxID=3366176 RepID=UPI00382BA5DF
MSYNSPRPESSMPNEHFRCTRAAHAAIGYIQDRDGLNRAEVIRRLVGVALNLEAKSDAVVEAIVLEDNR